MLTTPNTEEYPTSGIAPIPAPKSPWRVKLVEVLPNFCLRVVFMDGLEGTVDMSAMVHSKDAGVFAVLADPVLFEKAHLEYGAVTWPGELDLAPDAMHDEIKAHGEWILR